METSLKLISDDPDAPDGEIHYFGCVDAYDISEGLSGWVLNAAVPDEEVALELLVEGIAIPGATMVRMPRDDLAIHFPAHFEHAGFRLNPGGWGRFKTLSRLRGQADFAIRIAGTNFILPRADSVPNLAKIVAAFEAPGNNRMDLFSRLSQLSQQPAPRLAAPADEARKGLIEAVCLDDLDSRLCWFLGWTTETELYNEPAVVLDGDKLPGAFAVVTYPRDDVPAGGVGFAGVLLSDWRPHAGSELAVCYGTEGTSHLRGVAALKRVTKAQFAAHIKTAAGAGPSELWAELAALLNGPQSWQPETAASPDLQVAVDQLLVLPGFGCFATGWVISRLQEVTGFALKIGKAVLTMDEGSLYFRPRPDLKTLFPESLGLLNRAGFCCFFPSQAGLELAGPVLLKLFAAHGAAVIAVEPEHLQRLGRSLPLAALLQLYPAIETESFFPALAKYVRNNVHADPGLTVFNITPSPTAMIFALSEDRSDHLLTLEEIRHRARTHIPADCAVTIIAGAGQPHGELVQMLQSMPVKTSLVFVPHPETASRILPELLLLLGARRFIFVPPRHYLSETGWNEAAAAFMPGHDGPIIFGTYDPETLEDLNDSGACFAWSPAAFSQWSPHMPVRLGGMPKRQDFPAEPAPLVVARAAFISKSIFVSRLDRLLEQAINA